MYALYKYPNLRNLSFKLFIHHKFQLYRFSKDSVKRVLLPAIQNDKNNELVYLDLTLYIRIGNYVRGVHMG